MAKSAKNQILDFRKSKREFDKKFQTYLVDKISSAWMQNKHYVKAQFEVEKRLNYIDDFMAIEMSENNEVMKAWIEEVSDMKKYKKLLENAEREAIKSLKRNEFKNRKKKVFDENRWKKYETNVS